MNHVYILLAIYLISVILLSLVILLIPLPVLGMLTKPFSFRTFGIRKVRRWNSRTDTLGNLFLWLSVLFCVAFGGIPFAKWIYLVWMIFSWLACISRAVRLSAVRSTNQKMTVIFFLNLTLGIGLLAGMGFFNDFFMWNGAVQWLTAVEDGIARTLVYYLNEPNFFCYLLQAAVMLLPLFIFWGQFKYMRLENTYKARNIGLYVLKMLFWNAVILMIGMYSTPYLYRAYNKEAEIRIATSLDDMPADEVTLWSMFSPSDTDQSETTE